jgi:large subunit ribosomal protein L4
MHADRSSVFGLDAGGFDAPSTKQAAGLIADRRGGSVLVVLGEEEAAAAKSFRNLAGVAVLPVSACGVADVVGAATLVTSEVALHALTERARVGTPKAGGADQTVEPDAPQDDSDEEAKA